MNVACSVEHCSHPVTGQCTGYQGSCGQFYCSQHSKARLCWDCASRKEGDEVDEQLLLRYQELATKAPRVGCGTWAFGITLGVVSFYPLQLMGLNAAWIPMVPFILLFLWTNRRQQRYVSSITQSNPGFDRFYKEWRRAKDAASRGLAGRVALGTAILGGAFIGSAVDSNRRMEEEGKERRRERDQRRLSDDIHPIRKRMQN